MEGAEERIARLAARLEQVEGLPAEVRRLTAELAELRAGRGQAPRRLGGRARVGLVGLLVALVAAFPLVALAVDIFTDVPTGAPFHDQIEAIALGGITTGCTATPTYCPNDAVDRKAMAAFMHRGFGRIGATFLPNVTVPTSDSSITDWSLTLTPGLPANLLTGAAGFIKADAALSINWNGTVNCIYGARLYINGTSVNPTSIQVLIDASGLAPVATIPLTGALKVTSAGAKTVEARIFRVSGTCTNATAYGYLTAIYAPFGHAGGNAL